MGFFKIFKQASHASKSNDSMPEANSQAQKDYKGGVFRSHPKDSSMGPIKTIPYTSVSAQSPRAPLPHSPGHRSASSSFIPDPARAAYRTAGNSSSATQNTKVQIEPLVDRSRDLLEAKQREVRTRDASFKPLPYRPTGPVSPERLSGVELDTGQRRSVFGIRGLSSKSESSANRAIEHDIGGKPILQHARSEDQRHLGKLRSSVSLADVASATIHEPSRRSHLRNDSVTPLRSPSAFTAVSLADMDGQDISERKGHTRDIPALSVRPSPNTADNRNSSASLFRRDVRQDSFEIRSFRHVSGSGAGADGTIQDSHTSRSPQATITSDMQPPSRAEFARESRSVSMPRLSRPPSFAGSIGGEEPARQVSVQMFKQTRRLSTSSVFTLEAYQYADAEVDDTRSSNAATQSASSEQLRRSSTRGSAVEMLSSPPRKVLEPPENSISNRPSFDEASTEELSRAGNIGQGQGRFAPLVEMMADDRTINASPGIAGGRNSLRPGNNQRRAFSVASDVSEQQVDPSRSLSGSGDTRLRHPVRTHGRSQSTTSLPAIAVGTNETHDARGRTPLSQRLTNATSVTAAAVAAPDISDCLIPPFEAGSARLGQAKASSPVASITNGRRDASKPRVSSTTMSRSGWDSSSSEEENPPKLLKAKHKPKVVQSRNDLAVTGRSLPSGLRRPPAPSEAFGRDKWPEHSSDHAQTANREAAKPRSPSNLIVPSAKNRLSSKQSLSSETESESSSSSSDESLAVIIRKQSKNSLASKLSYSTPSLASPGPASPGSQSQGRSSVQSQSPPRVPSTRMTDARALPVPPTFAMAGLRTLHTSSWPHESPASSQSGTTGDNSSRVGPITPQDASPQVRPMFLNDPAKRSELRPADAGPRSVSFYQPDSHEHTSSSSMQRNTRRKAEIQAGIELGRLVNGADDRNSTPSANSGVQTHPPPSHSNMHDLNRAQYEQMVQMQTNMQMQMQMQMHMQMQMQQMHAAEMMPGYFNMHQQAMAAAKQQYQAAMAAAAIQAADEAWERASNAGGPGGFPHTSADESFSGGSLSGLPPVTPSLFGGSAYESHARPVISPRHRYASSASVYGESFGPPIHARPLPKLDTRASAGVGPETSIQHGHSSHRRHQSGSSFTSPLSSQATVPPTSWKTPSGPRTLYENHNDATKS